MRAHLYRPVLDNQGNVRTGGTVRVLDPVSLTAITSTLYADDTSTTQIANPFTIPTGIIEFYLAAPQRVRLGVVYSGEAERFFDGIDVILPFDSAGGTTGGLVATNNLSDLTDPALARVNLGLGSGTAVGLADLPAGVFLVVSKSSAGVWPARPTNRNDLIYAWKGPDPSPTIVSSGTGGMLNNVDLRFLTP